MFYTLSSEKLEDIWVGVFRNPTGSPRDLFLNRLMKNATQGPG